MTKIVPGHLSFGPKPDPLEPMLARIRKSSIPMDFWQKRAQKIDWAVGQVLCMKNGHLMDEWELRLTVAKGLEK